MTLTERFWSRVQRGEGCWTWSGGLTKGYGRLKIPGLRSGALAHRISAHLDGRLTFEELVTKGTKGPGVKCVMHTCDNPACVRPDHLVVGTHAENMADREAKGRNKPYRGPRPIVRGSTIGTSKLTEDQVVAIRAEHTGVYGGTKRLAQKYGIKTSTVRGIIRRDSWAHVA
jgi:hypothetical protein